MSEPSPDLFDLLLQKFRLVIREEIESALGDSKQAAIVKDWLTAKECSKLYGLPPTWFEEKGRAGEIARTKPGRYVLFKRRDVEEYLEKGKSNG
jgi:excisionase family DNA binding protein